MDKEALYEHLTTKQDLVDFLIEKGVTEKNIKISSQEQIKGIGDLRLYCDRHEEQSDVLVPARYIQHPTRQGNIGRSWFDLMYYAFYGVPENIEVNMASDRIWQLMVRNFVNEYKDFDTWNQLFSTKESKMANFDFDMYDLGPNRNPIYIQAGGNGGGTHRLILAKVTGVQNIFAKQLTIYKLNAQKKALYDKTKHLENELTKYINQSTYYTFSDYTKTIDLDMKYTKGDCRLILTEGICRMTEKDYEAKTPIVAYQAYLKDTLRTLQSFEKHLSKSFNFYRLLPLKFLTFLCESQSSISLEHEHIPDREKQLMTAIKLHLAYDGKFNH